MASSSARRKVPSSAPRIRTAAAPPAKSPEAPPRLKKRKTPPPPHPSEAEPPKRFQRTWPRGDEVRILEALAAHRRAHGGHLPTAAVLSAALDGRLQRKGVGPRELSQKQRSLKRRYDRDAKKVAPPADEHERRLYLWDVWAYDTPSPPKPPVPQATGVRGGSPRKRQTAEATTGGGKDALAPKPRTLAEMRELYPYLVDEAMVLVDPLLLQKLLPSIEDNEAQTLNKKIKRAKKQLTEAITELARMKNMEMPVVFLSQSTKLQKEKPRVDKKDGEDIFAEARWARVEREIAELKQIVMPSQNQAKIKSKPRHDNSSLKDIRYEDTESRPQSVIAENEIPSNILEKKVQVPNGLPHGNNEEVTSKYKYEGVLPKNVPRDNLKLQGSIKLPFKKFRGRMRKNDAESQTQRNVGGKEVVLLSLVRPHTPVGKAILQNSSRSAIVGGIELGTQYRKVFLSEVLQRDAPLFCPCGEMKMSDAIECSIAWPSVLIQENGIACKAAPHRPCHQGY